MARRKNQGATRVFMAVEKVAFPHQVAPERMKLNRW
jgi:hypothetical protein